MELINISKNRKGEQLISGRELHRFLESKQDFTTWMKNRIEKYGFVENEDFTLHKIMVGRIYQHDYVLKLDIAKEISMVEGNEKGREARKYFIEVEKKLKELPKLSEMQMIAKIAENADRQNERITAIEYKFENILTIDSGKQRKLQKAIASRVYKRYGEIFLHDTQNQADYILLKRKLFSAIHRELKNKFGISSYKDVKDSEFDIALNFVDNWIENADIRELS